MSNTKFRILCAASRMPIGVTAIELVRDFYGASQQPLKKAKTMLRHCRELSSLGCLDERGGATAYLYTEVRFRLTRAGYQAANERMNSPHAPTGISLCGGSDAHR